jgi:hypothetical protein
MCTRREFVQSSVPDSGLLETPKTLGIWEGNRVTLAGAWLKRQGWGWTSGI